MIKGNVPYVLCRIEDDSSLTPVSRHEDIAAAVAAGKHRAEVEDFDFGYGLYVDGGRVACFAEGRIGYREWARPFEVSPTRATLSFRWWRSAPTLKNAPRPMALPKAASRLESTATGSASVCGSMASTMAPGKPQRASSASIGQDRGSGRDAT